MTADYIYEYIHESIYHNNNILWVQHINATHQTCIPDGCITSIHNILCIMLYTWIELNEKIQFIYWICFFYYYAWSVLSENYYHYYFSHYAVLSICTRCMMNWMRSNCIKATILLLLLLLWFLYYFTFCIHLLLVCHLNFHLSFMYSVHILSPILMHNYYDDYYYYFVVLETPNDYNVFQIFHFSTAEHAIWYSIFSVFFSLIFVRYIFEHIYVYTIWIWIYIYIYQGRANSDSFKKHRQCIEK